MRTQTLLQKISKTSCYSSRIRPVIMYNMLTDREVIILVSVLNLLTSGLSPTQLPRIARFSERQSVKFGTKCKFTGILVSQLLKNHECDVKWTSLFRPMTKFVHSFTLPVRTMRHTSCTLPQSLAIIEKNMRFESHEKTPKMPNCYLALVLKICTPTPSHKWKV